MVNMIIADERTAFFQYDENAVLMVSGCDEVHFCHEGDEAAIVREVTYHDHEDDEIAESQYAVSPGWCGGRKPPKPEHGHRTEPGFVNVPGTLLETSEKLLCFGYGDGRTLCRFYFDVEPRPMPGNYVPESEIPKWSELSAELQKKLDRPPLNGSGGEYLIADAAGGTEWVPFDTELSLTSPNAVRNSVITKGINDAEERVSDAVDAVADDLAALDADFRSHSHPVDGALSVTSVNPVQNKAVKAALDGKSDTGHTHALNDLNGTLSVAKGGTGAADAATARTNLNAAAADHTHPVDGALSASSRNPVENRAVKTALDGKSDANHTHAVDDALSVSSPNPVENRVVTAALAGKSSTNHFHTVDMTLSARSSNPVENQAVTEALAGKAAVNHRHILQRIGDAWLTENLT